MEAIQVMNSPEDVPNMAEGEEAVVLPMIMIMEEMVEVPFMGQVEVEVPQEILEAVAEKVEFGETILPDREEQVEHKGDIIVVVTGNLDYLDAEMVGEVAVAKVMED